jgi:ribonuclease P protein component
MSKVFGFPKAQHVRKKNEFDDLYRTGNKLSGYYYSVYFRSGFFSRPRIGISIPGRLGNAVFRNRQKRAAREAFRRWSTAFASFTDLILVLNSVPSSDVARDRELDRIFAWLSGCSEA